VLVSGATIGMVGQYMVRTDYGLLLIKYLVKGSASELNGGFGEAISIL